jgi:O-antigen ligase
MEYAPPVRTGRAVALGGLGLAAAAALAAFAAALSLFLYSHPPSSLVVVGFAIVLLGSFLLAVTAYDVALAVGVVLLAAVRFEPAPTDVVFAVLIAVGLATSRFRLRRVVPGAVLLVGVFLAFNLISTVDVANGGRAVQFLGITVYVAALGLFVAAYVTSRRIAQRITRCYVAIAVVSAIVASLALFVPFPGHSAFTRIGRAEGLFKDPNVFGPFLVPAALIVMEEILSPRLLRGRRVTKLLMFLALSVGVVVSYSRAAWLNYVAGLLIVLVIVGLRRGGGRQAAQALAVVVAGIIAVSAVVAFSGSLSFLEQRARVQTYDQGRFAGQSESIKWAMQYPFGIGPGQFEKRAHIAAHSMYARALAEEGVPGLLVLIALVLATLVYAIRNAIEGRDTYGIGSAALLGAWCGILLNGAFVDTLHWRHLWLVAALIWAGASRAYDTPAARRAASPASP